MEEEEITLQEAAKLVVKPISASTVYYYIKKGLLPKPKHIPNTKKGRGSLAVYPVSMVRRIQYIRDQLAKNHSINELINEVAPTNEDIKKLYSKTLDELSDLVKKGKHNEPEFKRGILLLSSGTGPASMIDFSLFEKKNKK